MPENLVKNVYLMGIGGIAMGTLAAMLKESGRAVTGSDAGALYPPMSTQLQALGIPYFSGFEAENLRRAAPDLVVVGNVIRRENPEAQALLAGGLPYCSMPQALARFFLDGRESLVVAGTHGKTTTSALLAHVLTEAGYDPVAFVGGVVRGWGRGFRLGGGPHMVFEGDEYDTAFFDKGPKFVHYRSKIGILTSVEFDHADIFPDLAAVEAAFRLFVAKIPEDGALVVNSDDPRALAVASGCRGRVVTYGEGREADWRLTGLGAGDGLARLAFRVGGGPERVAFSRLPGRHNAMNALAVCAAAQEAGVSPEAAGAALPTFLGVSRRQEVLGEARGVLVVDDFAHHPTAVRETIAAMRLMYPKRRIVTAFEPRTNSSRRAVFQREFAESFNGASLVAVKAPPGMEKIPEGERLDAGRLVSDIAMRGVSARLAPTADDMLDFLLGRLAPGDLVLCMSNGSFDGLPARLLSALAGGVKGR